MVGKNKRKRNNRNKNKIKDTLPIDKLDSEKEEKVTADEELNTETHDSDEEVKVSLKRDYSENESDEEDKPKKKKKKQRLPVETTEKKGKQSIRQMKKEKHAQRQAEAQVAAKDQLKTQCVSYLSQWKHDRQNWKFMKAKQVWLYKNKFSSHLVPDASWPTLLEYFESAKGNIRNMLLDDANKIIKQMDEWIETSNSKDRKDDEDENEESETAANKPDDTTYKRARDLIQCLQE